MFGSFYNKVTEWTFLTPKDLGSNQIISNFIVHLFTVDSVEKVKIAKKITGMAHLKSVYCGEGLVDSQSACFNSADVSILLYVYDIGGKWRKNKRLKLPSIDPF